MINWLLALSLASTAYGGTDPHSFLKLGSHCVGYLAKKRLLLVAAVEVQGKSCDILVQVIPEVGGKAHIELGFPLLSLKSGEEKRDQDVVNLLKADENAELKFHSVSFTSEEWQKKIQEGHFQLNGFLSLKGADKAVEATVSLENGEAGPEVDGIIKTTFSDLNIVPPKLGFGLFAQVKNDLELHFHFLASRSLGADILFPPPR